MLELDDITGGIGEVDFFDNIGLYGTVFKHDNLTVSS